MDSDKWYSFSKGYHFFCAGFIVLLNTYSNRAFHSAVDVHSAVGCYHPTDSDKWYSFSKGYHFLSGFIVLLNTYSKGAFMIGIG
ncbi:hypothetical protein [Pedobacter miscanthi]|jgi:hypothetical protein|uniref:hypothetical protein n=1 Tax=Pedobacter miscanthi TaxID=2259170 RepID=UPI00292FF633|nr:hypothetical protein [Pedobacter miscanthi]